MVKRYDLYFGGFDVGYIVEEADDGGYVAYDDYAALQAENERLKALEDAFAEANSRLNYPAVSGYPKSDKTMYDDGDDVTISLSTLL